MKPKPRLRRALVAIAVLAALLAAALVWLPDIVARALALHYLERAGVTATIGDIDVDLLTGTLVLENAEGHGPDGDGFSIGRLRLTIDYAPLWSKRVRIPRLALADTAIDVRRTADNALRIGGVTMAGGRTQRPSSPDWGLALQKLTLQGLRIHYVQPAHGQQPAVDRELIFNDSSARDVVTWEKHDNATLDADVRVGDSRIRLKGQITPFGDTLSGHFDLRTEHFSLELLSPLTRPGNVQRLTGVVDSDQQIDFRYDPAKALHVTIDGRADWRDSTLALAHRLKLTGERFAWQGKLTFQLLRADGAPATLNSDGRLQATAPMLSGPGAVRLSQVSADWQGQASVTLGADGVLAHGNGKYAATNLQLQAANGLHVETPALKWNGAARFEPAASGHIRMRADGAINAVRMQARVGGAKHIDAHDLDWQGHLQTRTGDTLELNGNGALSIDELTINLAGDGRVHGRGLRWDGKLESVRKQTTHVDSDATLKAKALSVRIPQQVKFETAPLSWRGTIDFDAGSTPHVHGDGRMDTGALTFAVPDSARFKAADAFWKGALDVDIGTPLAHTARGRLIVNHARLLLPGQPLASSADRLVFNGDYHQRPGDDGTLELGLSGDLAGQAFALTNTAIDAPWTALRDVEVHGLAVDGVERIGFDRLVGQGVRLLGDTDTRAAVVDAITARVRGFHLNDLRRYRVAALDIDGANIHLRRDANGMGVMALYFSGNDEQNTAGDTTPAAATKPTFAVDHLSLSAPLIAFNDVSVTPAVSLQGAQMTFNLDGLDTGDPERDASYRLSLDVGRYGHFDSLGTIAPLARGGMNMAIDAWMRSLALAPLSGYLNAAMGRRIARGVADGTLDLKAQNGQLDGNLDTTLANFRLVEAPGVQTEIVLGISMDTALDMVRRDNDLIRFETAILGDVTNPYFSIRNLVREAVLAGLRTTVLSDYSPLGLLNNVKNSLLKLGRSPASRPVVFAPGRHYVRAKDRGYLSGLAQSMRRNAGLRLTIRGHAGPGDAKAMANFAAADSDRGQSLAELARRRAAAVRDYLAARDVDPDRLDLARPAVENDSSAGPRVTFTLDKP